MTAFSCSVYPGSSITSSRGRTGSGTAPGSVAVTIHTTLDRSNGSWRYRSSNAMPCTGSRTSRNASARSVPARSIASITKTGFRTPASRRPRRMHPGTLVLVRPWTRCVVSSLPSVTRTWGRPSASAAATASDVLPVPPGPARHGTRTGARGSRGRTSSAEVTFSAPPRRGGASTVSRPPARRLAASTSTRRLLTRSRPPWVRSRPCRRRTGSNRAGACVRHGSATAIAVRASAFSTASTPDACAACWRARRSIAWTSAGSSPLSRAASTRSTRGPPPASARTAASAPSGSPSPGEGAAPASTGTSTADADHSAASQSTSNACASSTRRASAVTSGRPHRGRCSSVVTT